jgi:hypothetical protein
MGRRRRPFRDWNVEWPGCIQGGGRERLRVEQLGGKVGGWVDRGEDHFVFVGALRNPDILNRHFTGDSFGEVEKIARPEPGEIPGVFGIGGVLEVRT